MKSISEKYCDILRKTFQLFVQSNSLKLSASLSYYTVFPICPFLTVIISPAGVF
jgi:membrane protein